MNINTLLKKEGVTILNKLSILETNIIAHNIASKLCKKFPEHDFNQQDLFIKFSRLNMYVAEFNYSNSMAKYFPQNKTIYFNKNIHIDDLDTICIHECLHYLQESLSTNNQLGLSNTSQKPYCLALNEAAVQLMASDANDVKEDIVTYYNLTLPTTSPTYYTLQCALIKQITFFTGTYPLYHSAINSNTVFKTTVIHKVGKHIFNIIMKNLDNLVELEDILLCLTNDLKYCNGSDSKIKSLNSLINLKKEEIFKLFLKTQNIIMTNFFNTEFNNIRNIEDLKNFKSRVYNYQYLIGTNKNYTFYKDFFYYTMNRIQDKESYLEKKGYILLPNDKELALTLFEENNNFISFFKHFFNKFKKISYISKISLDTKKE